MVIDFHTHYYADMERIIKKHSSDRVLFGSDSPWKREDIEIEMINALDLPKEDIDNILYRNALSLIE